MAEDNNKHQTKLPLGVLALEFLGTALMGLGLAKKFGGLDLVPAISQFDESGWLLIIAGFLLTIPHVLHILGKARENADQKITK